MKVIINSCYGGFGLSLEALKRCIEEDIPVLEKKTIENSTEKDWNYYMDRINIKYGKYKTDVYEIYLLNEKNEVYIFQDSSNKELRTNLELIKIIEELGEKANGKAADLKIVDVPDDVDWEINEYDGIESIHEKHRVWY